MDAAQIIEQRELEIEFFIAAAPSLPIDWKTLLRELYYHGGRWWLLDWGLGEWEEIEAQTAHSFLEYEYEISDQEARNAIMRLMKLRAEE